MQEHGEVAAHRFVTLGHHFLGRGAHHDMVAVAGREPQQPVAYRATDEIDLHAWMMPHFPSPHG
jgi:hypothetical protein